MRSALVFLLCGLAAAQSPPSQPSLERLEVVARDVSTGDGGNSWGTHKLRIVRTAGGVFTAYATGSEYLTRSFRLARRSDSGWQTVLEGPGGREPVNVVGAPGGLRLIAWPQGLPVLYSGTRDFHHEPIPGDWNVSDWPYHGAAISAAGRLSIVTSYGDTPGEYCVASQTGTSAAWQFRRIPVPYRHCYAIALPRGSGMEWVAVRDILWEHLGWKAPPGAFRYLFNGLHLVDWSPDRPPRIQPLVEEPQTPEYLGARCSHSDAYLDTRGRLHLLYEIRGATTRGRTVFRHRVLDSDGRMLADVELPQSGPWRILQNSAGVFHLMVPSGGNLFVYRGRSADGTDLDAPRQFDLKTGRVVDHLFLAVPRGGTVPADFADGVFLSAENNWVYFRVSLP